MARNRIARVDLEVGKSRFDRDLASSGRDLRRFARDGKRELGAMSNDNHGRRMLRQRLADGGREYTSAANNKAPPPSVGKRAARAALQGVGVAAIAGGAALLSFADDAYALEKGLVRYKQSTNSSEASMAAFREQLKRASIEAGISRQELLGGAAAYVTLTGDAEGAASAMTVFGKVQNATGAAMADIAGTAAAMKDNLGIDPKDFEAGFSALVVQGKEGAVELRDLAAEMADLAPAMQGFKGGRGLKGLIETGAALQAAKKGAGTASKAATNLMQLSNAMIRNSAKFKAKGIRIFDKKGEKRNFLEIIDDVRKKGLSEPALINMLGSSEALSAMRELLARKDLVNGLITSGGDKGAVNRDATEFLESPAGRIQKAWEQVKLKMIEAFTPERIENFAGALEKVVMLAAKAADLLDKLITGGEKEDELLSDEQRLKVSRMSTGAGNKLLMPGAAQFKTDDAKFYGQGQGGDEDYSLGSLLRYGQGLMRAPQSATQIAGQVAGAVPGGDVVRQVMDGMMAAAGRMDFKVILNGEVLGRAAANSPHHRTRPGGR